MKKTDRWAQPYKTPEVRCRMFGIDTSFCASSFSAQNEDFEDYETEYTLE